MPERLIATIVAIAIAAFVSARYRTLNVTYDRTRPAVRSDAGFARLYKVLIAIAVAVALAAYWVNASPLLKLYDSGTLRLIGTLVSVVGVGGFEASVRALGEQYSPCFDLRASTKRVITGPYRWLSHPMYTSNIVILAGVFISSGSFWVLFIAALVSIYYLRSARTEHKMMANLQ
jgi:protein-S-isoprenylcysteine O-methyltransferase Ste14